MPVIVQRGRFIARASVNIKNRQVRFQKPIKVKLNLFRNDELGESQIYICMPWGNLYVLESFTDDRVAKIRYDFLLTQLKSGLGKIEITGSSFKFIDNISGSASPR